MVTSFSNLYPGIAGLLADGATLDVNGGGYEFQIASLYDGSQAICQFVCSEMSADRVLSRLEELATRYKQEGIVTDDVNGTTYSVW